MSGDFDLCGELPTGTTVLEASAGTGKTYTIAALATRYVAEGHAALHELMLVTFGRAATQELRERVRERLVSTERDLADPAYARASDDGLLRLLADVPDAEVAERRNRLATAMADFDAATIATTHGFAAQMLTGLGMDGDLEPGTTFVESTDDLVQEVVQDLYLRKWGLRDSDVPTLTYAEVSAVVRTAVRDRHATLAPDNAPADSEAAQRYRLASNAREEVERRKRMRRLRDYDDLLTRLRDAMLDPERGEVARRRVRERYRVVMVDEFQDTDPVQWEILELAFAGHTTLILIGDPKQAIYAFRGGDVVAYLAAKRTATTHQTLGRNWRSDAPLLEAHAAVFRSAALGDPEILVRPVEAAHPGRRLTGAPSDAPMRLRQVTRSRLGVAPDGKAAVANVRRLVAEDVAAEVTHLLASGATVSVDRSEQVAPGHLAILVRTNDQATLTRDALAAAGVPAVLTGAVDIFSTEMALAWLTLLQALEQPHRAARVRTAALSCFVGWSATRLATAGDDAVDELGPLLRGWADVLARRGVPALLEVVTETGGLPARMLSRVDGERDLTDLRHVAEALHAAAVHEQLGTAALVEWLQRRIADSSRPDVPEERSRRLESDADAVQVVTVHRSKGLEFPIVLVPFAWDRWVATAEHPRFHTDDGLRCLDVGGKNGPDFTDHCARNAAEESGEDLRLLYVALTRAQCQVVTWWAPSANTATSPLNRLLFGSFAVGSEPPAKVKVPSDDEVRTRLAELTQSSAGCVVAEEVTDIETSPWLRAAGKAPRLVARAFDRQLDGAWRRTSYSALTAGAHDAAHESGVASEPEGRALDDESAVVPAPVEAEADPAVPVLASPMAHLPGGTSFGLVVHSVLESADTSAADLAAELAERGAEALSRRHGATYDASQLATALLPSLETPLGPLADGLRLRDVIPSDRLAELDFELPLAGGDDPVATEVTVAGIAALLRQHLPADDSFAAYPDLLDGPAIEQQRLRGFLVGSIDAVLRVGPASSPRFLVVDYKTNWLGSAPAGSGDLTTHDYRPTVLREAMLAAHYPLQLLLYLVALHRFLRWRVPGYSPDVHLGGGLYCFLRGMVGADTPVSDGMTHGVFAWSPPSGLVDALSRLLAGEQP